MGNVENKHSAPCLALPSYACNSLGCSYVSSQSADTIGQLDIGLCDLWLLVSSEIKKETIVLGNKLRCVIDLASFSVQMTLNISS